MSKKEDYVYEDAPLVEVIAEVRWHLLTISSMPNAAIDPYFERGHTKVREALAGHGLKHLEEIVPPDVPRELLAGKPVFRFRRAPGKWPLVQFGPGILTVNITPPYEGWAEFRKSIETALRVIDGIYSFGSEFSKIMSYEVRYIDAFTERFGMRDPSAFLADDLSMPSGPPPGVLERLMQEGANVLPNVRFRFPVKDRENDVIVLSAAHGVSDGMDAIIYDLRMQHSVAEGIVKSADDVLTWMDEAHERLHTAFEETISDRLRERFGKKRAVRA